jgi:site-specific recombinase XerD
VRTHAAASHPARAVFEGYLDAFIEDLRARHYSPAALVHARTYLPPLFSYLRERGLVDVHSISAEDLVSFAQRLTIGRSSRGSHRSPATVASYLGYVRGFFAFLSRTGVLLKNPAAELPLPSWTSLPRRVLTTAEARRLVQAPSGRTAVGRRNRALLEVLYGTGVRLSESVRLDVMDVDLQDGTLLVRNGKGRKDRLLPVAGRAAAALGAYLRKGRPHLARDPREAALFLSRDGRRLRPISIQFLVGWHAARAGIRGKVSPHVLRHSCATHLLQGGADVRHIQELLGHERLETTSVYTRVAVKDLRIALARSHPREKRRQRAGLVERARK